jgi:hypothetical protein
MKKMENFVRRYTSVPAVIDILRRKELPLLDPQSWDDRNDRYFMSLYKEAKSLNGLYGLCAAICSETYHHWRVFTSAAEGACIEIKRSALENQLKKIGGVRYGEIKYLKLEQAEKLGPNDIDKLPFIKRWGFSPEVEYRIIAESSEGQAQSISFDFPIRLINSIHLNPWMPKSIAESIVQSIREIEGCSKLEIKKSYLTDSARWKKVGDRILGRKSGPKLKLKRSKPAK